MKSRGTGSVIAFAVAAVGALTLICWRSVAVETVYPVENAARAVRTGFWPRVVGMFRAGAVEAENVRLRREKAALELLRGDAERTERENARLRRALDYVSRQPETWVAAGVLSSGGGAAAVRDVLRVDKGSLAGIRRGAVVVVPAGLVGRVTAVSPHTAEVTLVTDPSLRVACRIGEDEASPVAGVLSGGNEERLVLRHLTGSGRRGPGDRVFTSGLGGVFPRGLEIGTLQSLTNGARGLEGEVLPRVDYSTLEDVFIRRAQ